jgi:glutathione S-transferase
MRRAVTVADTRRIEERADARIGVHVRRLAYGALLPSSGHLVKAELFRNLSPAQRVAGTAMWPVTRRLMIRALDISPQAASESRAILESALDWLDEHLSDGRQYLAGDRFSRADIAVASLLASFARPLEVPAFQAMVSPPDLAADCERWRERAVIRFVRRLYRDHRAPRMALCAA